MYTNTLMKLSKSLSAQYETIFQSSTNVGNSREEAVRQFLEKVMPGKYGFDRGETFDKNDKNSGEIELIIYDKLFSVVFKASDGKILAPVESTYGIIEIKSTLTSSSGESKGTLEEAIEKLRQYDQLERPEAPDGTVYLTPDHYLKVTGGVRISKSDNQRINGIFAFTYTASKKRILEKAAEAGFIDYIVVPGEFCYIGRERNAGKKFHIPGKKGDHLLFETEYSIGIWVILLDILLANSRLVGRQTSDLLINLVREAKIHSL